MYLIYTQKLVVHDMHLAISKKIDGNYANYKSWDEL